MLESANAKMQRNWNTELVPITLLIVVIILMFPESGSYWIFSVENEWREHRKNEKHERKTAWLSIKLNERKKNHFLRNKITIDDVFVSFFPYSIQVYRILSLNVERTHTSKQTKKKKSKRKRFVVWLLNSYFRNEPRNRAREILQK